ncbi:MAG: iron uptake system component EfeO [Mycobacterium sp.]|jgi:iron uptake system EfeUOB component EfeO/EfeM|nr:iron uptake system component EfeO [Mycobacterium sp.]
MTSTSASRIQIGVATTSAALAAITFTSCTAKQPDAATPAGATGAANQFTVNATDTACELSGATATTGPSTFIVTNNGGKVTEFYVYGAGDRVMGEVENVSPGLQRKLVVQLTEPGKYQTACKPGMIGDGLRGDFTVLREADLEPGQKWTGFHALEKQLWVTGLQPDANALADQLVADVKELDDGVKAPGFIIDSTRIASGAQTLLDEIGKTKITGEEDIFGHSDLWDFEANIQGSQTAVASIRSILEQAKPELGGKVDQRFADVEALLSKYRTGDGFVLYDTVSEPQRQELSRSIDALSGEVSQVQGVIASQ